MAYKIRDTHLDTVRALACMLVVLMHSPMPSDDAPSIFLASISYFTAPCIGLFFMVSGSLLLPVKTDMFSFLHRRFTKIVIPLLIWTALYLTLRLYGGEYDINILRSVFSIPFSPQGNGVLWFIYTLSGLYLLAPIMSPWLERCSRREVETVLVLWAITLCYPLLDRVVEINHSSSGILYYFGGFAGYFLLGYYIRRYDALRSTFTLCILTMIAVASPVLARLSGAQIDFYEMFWYLSIFVGMLCVVYYRFAYRFAPGRILSSVSRYSFGIYLCHILVMRSFLYDLTMMQSIQSYILQTGLLFLFTMVLSYMLCKLISLLPGAVYIIGIGRTKS